MKKYRIKEIAGKFYPQERFLFFFWNDIKLYDKVSRDWFNKSAQDDLDNGAVDYLACRDAWGSTIWLQPEFKTLERAKLFIEEYEEFLRRKHEKQQVKYYY